MIFVYVELKDQQEWWKMQHVSKRKRLCHQAKNASIAMGAIKASGDRPLYQYLLTKTFNIRVQGRNDF